MGTLQKHACVMHSCRSDYGMSSFVIDVFVLMAVGVSAVYSPVRVFESRYHSASTLQATFLERYTESGQTVRTEAGTAYFRRPGKMRWEYESPEKSLFVIDGKTAWFYVPADRTVTRVPAKKSEDWRTPFVLLTGEMKVSRLCSKVETAPDDKPIHPGDVVLRCIPKGEKPDDSKPPAKPQSAPQSTNEAALEPSNIQRILFEISPDSGELARVLVQEPGGASIDFQFRNWQFNVPLPESLFHFQPPPGVAIVNGQDSLPNAR